MNQAFLSEAQAYFARTRQSALTAVGGAAAEYLLETWAAKSWFCLLLGAEAGEHGVSSVA